MRFIHLRGQGSTEACQAHAKCAQMVTSTKTVPGKGTCEASAWWEQLAARGKSVQEDLGEAEPACVQGCHWLTTPLGRWVWVLRLWPEDLET